MPAPERGPPGSPRSAVPGGAAPVRLGRARAAAPPPRRAAQGGAVPGAEAGAAARLCRAASQRRPSPRAPPRPGGPFGERGCGGSRKIPRLVAALPEVAPAEGQGGRGGNLGSA